MRFTLIFALFMFFGQVHAQDTEIKLEDDQNLVQYTVKEYDTLMIIAFNIYGDYRKWKELLELNPNIDKKNMKLDGIKVVNYRPPEKVFTWQPLGEPYLIQKGDTLGKVSKKVYNTSKRWKEIYINNRPMIRYPNLIFEGFTLYYVPDPLIKPLN
ncbi:MAG: LysM peptidoglycan-binding domain-containing protein [Bacteriovoracaceae bacterium]|nr:LysM peptidoglycan-binding domain-containing protein [Bacteriovoracaceae bacterium]